MITEDYVSFETAKLLKEKGFDEITFTWYTGKGKLCFGKNNFDDYHMNHLSNMATAIDKNKCSAPTLQMAMKWLREDYNIDVAIYPYGEYSCNNYQFDVYIDNNLVISKDDGYVSYEQACETAIKYCLEKLIVQ